MNRNPVSIARSTLIAGAVAALGLVSANATNIIVSNPQPADPLFLNTAGAPLADGSLIRVGFFADWATEETNIRNGTLIEVDALFTEVGGVSDEPPGSGTGTITINGALGSEGGGRTFGQIQNVNIAGAYAPTGARMVLFVHDATTADPGAGWGVFGAVGSEWNVPPSNLTPIAMNLGAVGAIDAIVGAVTPGGDVRLVPEPGVFALLSLGGFLAIFRRRRRS